MKAFNRKRKPKHGIKVIFKEFLGQNLRVFSLSSKKRSEVDNVFLKYNYVVDKYGDKFHIITNDGYKIKGRFIKEIDF